MNIPGEYRNPVVLKWHGCYFNTTKNYLEKPPTCRSLTVSYGGKDDLLEIVGGRKTHLTRAARQRRRGVPYHTTRHLGKSQDFHSSRVLTCPMPPPLSPKMFIKPSVCGKVDRRSLPTFPQTLLLLPQKERTLRYHYLLIERWPFSNIIF
jgi:hypothetical protein